MKRSSMSVCALMCFAVLNLPCIAQDNPWNGSWKLDPASVKYVGPTYSVKTDAEGYTVTRQGKPDPKVICDGQPHAMPKGVTTVCTKAGSGYEVESNRNGKLSYKGKIELTADGNTRTSSANLFPEGAAPFTRTITSKRVSGGPGMSGVWKEVKVEEPEDQGVLTIEVKGDSVGFKETDVDKPITCKLDGTEMKTSATSTMSVKQVSPTTLKVTYRLDGEIRRENTFVLSPDGKTITETDVTPNPSPSTTSMRLHKS
jgi:hypothetical protein